MEFVILFVLIFFVSAVAQFDISRKLMILLSFLFAVAVFLVEGFMIKKFNLFYLFLYLLMSAFLLGWDYLIKYHGNKNILDFFRKKRK